MGFKLVDSTWNPNLQDYVKVFLVDQESDVASLPESCTYSKAIVLDVGAVYMVDTTGQWKKYGGDGNA